MVSYLSEQGGTPSALAWQIFQLAKSSALKIHVRHIPGKHNVLLDPLSLRGPVQMEWALDWSVFQALVAPFGLSPVIDLLVTHLNSRLSVFLCPLLDPAEFSVDTP